MHELVRALVILPVAVLLPLASPKLWPRRRRAVIAVSLGVIALAPHYEDVAPWLLVLAAVIFASVPTYGGHVSADTKLPVALAAVLALACVLALGASASWHAVERVVNSSDAVLILGGGLIGVFLGGVLIERILRPFAGELQDSGHGRGGLANAGLIIGWIERVLLYGLFVAGAPDAAAVVLGVKSIARFPEFKDERFAEYYLIGSFLSVLAAMAPGLAVRAIIGLHPLIPTQL